MADLRALVRASVEGRRPVDDREARSRTEILAAFDRLADPFDQQADPTHVTGSALVLGPRGILLHRHKRLGLWLQPGGHLEPGETPWDAAHREAMEETGLALEITSEELGHLDVHEGGRGHTHLDLRYVFTVEPDGRDEPSPPPGESQDVRWYSWPEALTVADPGLAGWIRAWVPRP